MRIVWIPTSKNNECSDGPGREQLTLNWRTRYSIVVVPTALTSILFLVFIDPLLPLALVTRETILVGFTTKTDHEINQVIQTLSKEYTGNE